jgi:hypothetical protein
MALASGLAMSGCLGGMIAGADYDRSVVIGQPATFAWNEPDGLPVGDPRLDNNPFFVERLHGAIARQLASRGVRMAVAERRPTLLVHHHASVQDHVQVYPSEQTGNLSPYGPGTEVVQYEEGNFLVDVSDAGTGKVIWRGWARADLSGALDDDQALDELLERAVARMFEFFPIPVGTLPAVEEEPPMIEPVPEIETVPLPRPDVAGGAGRPRPDVEGARELR